MANQNKLVPSTRPTGSIWHFTQSGSGTQSGKTEANSLPISSFATFSARPGDTLALHGTITSEVQVNGTYHNGDYTSNVIITGGLGTLAYLNPNSATINALSISPTINTEHIMVCDLTVGTCGYGIYGFHHWNYLRDITVKNIHVINANKSGIQFESTFMTFNTLPATCSNVIIEDCIVDSAGYHGIAMMINSDNSCRIRRCIVHFASNGGNFWGIYVASQTKTKTSPVWTGTNPYEITVSNLGWTSSPQWQTIQQLAIRNYTNNSLSNMVHFNKGIYGSLNNWEFGQNGIGGNVQIKLPAPDATIGNYSVYSSIFQQTGGIIEECEAHNITNNGGTTDGVGIGTDLLASNWTIKNCYTHDNEGRGFELSLSSGCKIINCTSINNGNWDYNIYNTGRLPTYVSNCKGIGASSNSFYIQQCEGGNVYIDGNFAINAGAYDYITSVTQNALYSNNISFNCGTNNASAAVDINPLELIILHKTSTYNVTAQDSETIFDNLNATTNVTFNLPIAITGLEYTFRRMESFNVIIDAAGTDIFSDSAIIKTLASNNSYIYIKCFFEGIWHIMASRGTIT